MRILYLVHQFFPQHYTGTERFVLSVATLMQKAGHKVRVVAFGTREDSYYDQASGGIRFKTLTYRELPVLIIQRGPVPELLRDDGAVSMLAQDLADMEKPDIVHVGHPQGQVGVLEAFARRGVPYVVTLTDFFLMCPKSILRTTAGASCLGPDRGRACEAHCPELPPALVRPRLRVAQHVLLNASAVVAPSATLASLFAAEFPGLDITVINYGVSYGSVRPNRRRYANSDDVTFGYAGSLSRHKGVHVLVEAFRQVRSATARLRIYGSGSDLLYVEELRAQARPDARIEFRGVYKEDQTGEVLAGVDALVVPSLWHENSPFVVREALACEVPVVASAVGGIAEHVDNGGNGFLFRTGDARMLALILQRIADRPALLNPLKDRLRTTPMPTVEQEACQYERLYRMAIGERRRRITGPESLPERLGRIRSMGEEIHRTRPDVQAAYPDVQSESFWVWMNVWGLHEYEALRELLVPIPPELLQSVEGGGLGITGQYLLDCAQTYEALARTLDALERPLSSFATTLELGCGAGGVLRFMLAHAGSVDYVATTADRAAVNWTRSHFPFGRFHLTGSLPSLLPAHAFDLVYSTSVLLSATEAEHDQWLEELQRVGRPGGVAVLALYGRRSLERAAADPQYSHLLGLTPGEVSAAQRRLSSRACAFPARAARGDGGPGAAAFITGDYVRERWAGDFEILSFHEGGLLDSRDLVALRIPDGAGAGRQPEVAGGSTEEATWRR